MTLQKYFNIVIVRLLSHSDKEIPKESYNEQIKSTNGSVLYQHMFHLEMAYSYQVLQVLHFQKDAVRYIMVHMRMMRLEVRIRTAAVLLIMQ